MQFRIHVLPFKLRKGDYLYLPVIEMAYIITCTLYGFLTLSKSRVPLKIYDCITVGG